MSNSPRIYRSTDPGAPQLSGQAGSFAAVMDAVLVNGYGSGGTAKAPLGWILAHTATTKRAYRNDPAQYSGNHLRFDDTNGQFVLVDGYAEMSSIDSGSERFESQSRAWNKSPDANSQTRSWIVIGTGKCFYYLVDIATNNWTGFFAGDMNMLGKDDIWRFAYTYNGTNVFYPDSSLMSSARTPGIVFSRSSNGVINSRSAVGHPMLFSGSVSSGINSVFSNPLSTTKSFLLCRMFISELVSNNREPRAWYPGVWGLENHPVPSGVVYSNVTGLPAGTELLCHDYNTGSGARALFDLTNDW